MAAFSSAASSIAAALTGNALRHAAGANVNSSPTTFPGPTDRSGSRRMISARFRS